MNLHPAATLLAALATASCTAATPAPAPSHPIEPAVTYDHDPNVSEELRIRGGLPNFFAKAQAGQPVTVAYLGGSITNAPGWRPKTFAWLQARFPFAQFTEIEAAVSGTGADYAACRLADDVLPHRPDLVFIEFRVNGGGGFEARAIEGVIRQLREADPSVDLCLVYTLGRWMLNDLKKGKQHGYGILMEKAANHYGIPSIDFAPDIVARLAAGELIFEAPRGTPTPPTLFSHDGVHPTDEGHTLYTDVVARAFTQILDHGTPAPTPAPHALPPAVHANHLGSATLLPASAAIQEGDWQTVDPEHDAIYRTDPVRTPDMLRGAVKTTQQGAALTVRWTGTAIALHHIPQDEAIEIAVSVDGQPARPHRLKQEQPGKRYARFLYLPEQPQGDHEATIRVTDLPEAAAFYAGQFRVLRDPVGR